MLEKRDSAEYGAEEDRYLNGFLFLRNGEGSITAGVYTGSTVLPWILTGAVNSIFLN